MSPAASAIGTASHSPPETTISPGFTSRALGEQLVDDVGHHAAALDEAAEAGGHPPLLVEHESRGHRVGCVLPAREGELHGVVFVVDDRGVAHAVLGLELASRVGCVA